MELVRVSYRVAHISDGEIRQFQKFGCLDHPVVHEEFFRRLSDCFFKDPAEIASVQAADLCDAFNRYIILEVLFYVGQSFFYIEIPDAAFRGEPHGGGGAGHIIYEQIKVADQMER